MLGYIDKAVQEGASLVTGGGRPAHLERGWFVEPTVFGNVDNSATIAREEIFGPVLSVIPAKDERDAVRVADDTIYGLNASVFTDDVERRAWPPPSWLRHGRPRRLPDRLRIALGGFKQSGSAARRTEGLYPFLEMKTALSRTGPGPTALKPAHRRRVFVSARETTQDSLVTGFAPSPAPRPAGYSPPTASAGRRRRPPGWW